MANEATLVVETGKPINFTVSDSTGIEKGTILTLSDPWTAAATTADDAIMAGIAAAEKIASDGVTKLAVYREGVFKVTGSGNITVGDALITSIGGTNRVEAAGVNAEDIVGIALETSTDGESLLIELGPRTCNLA